MVGAAGTGLLLGTASIHLVHDALRRRHGDAVGWAVVGAVVPLVGIGIALGRFARWNGWDVVLAPQIVAGDVLMWAGAPLAHAGAMAAAALLAGLVGAAYLVMHLRARPVVPRTPSERRRSPAGPAPGRAYVLIPTPRAKHDHAHATIAVARPIVTPTASRVETSPSPSIACRAAATM